MEDPTVKLFRAIHKLGSGPEYRPLGNEEIILTAASAILQRGQFDNVFNVAGTLRVPFFRRTDLQSVTLLRRRRHERLENPSYEEIAIAFVAARREPSGAFRARFWKKVD